MGDKTRDVIIHDPELLVASEQLVGVKRQLKQLGSHPRVP
jgi:hypothetical protein